MPTEKSSPPLSGEKSSEPATRKRRSRTPGRRVMTKRGVATRFSQAEIDAARKILEAAGELQPVSGAPQIMQPFKRTQVCGKHNTLMVAGRCRKCMFEEDKKGMAKRKREQTMAAKEAHAPTPYQDGGPVGATQTLDTGETAMLGGE